MLWVYSVRVSAPKWANPDVQTAMENDTYYLWEKTATEAGYTPVDGTLTETVVPLWQHEDATIDDQAEPGVDPEQIAFRVTGEVTAPEPPPAEEPVVEEPTP